MALFFFNDTATTEIYTLSLHDALPIWNTRARLGCSAQGCRCPSRFAVPECGRDRKSTRLNSSHSQKSYAVFCLKKKKEHIGVHLCAPHAFEARPPSPSADLSLASCVGS